MGFKIGCPAMKLARIKGKNAGNRIGNLQAILCEAWECGQDADGKPYRLCKDADYNPALTAQNRYEGIRNAFELGREIVQTADEYSQIRFLRGGRKIKKNAAIGYNMILKPPAEYVNGLSAEEQKRLADDLLTCFRIATADIIRQDTINAVWQTDEAGGHWHIAGPAIMPDGELNADKIINPRLYTALNKTLPAEMRKRNWPCDECINYDPDKAKQMTDSEKAEYKRECKAKRPKSGMSSDKYKAQKDRERLEHLEGLAKYCEGLKYPDGSTVLSRYEAKVNRQKPVEGPQKPVEGPQKPKPMHKPVAPIKPVEGPQKPVEAPVLDAAAQARVKATLESQRKQRQQRAEADAAALTANLDGGHQGYGGRGL